MRHVAVVAVLLLLLASTTAPLSATPAIPPEKPRQSHVRVVLANGGTLDGTLLELSPAAVSLLVNGSRRDYRLDDVAAVERRGDSLINGALIGAAVAGGLCLVFCWQGAGDDTPGVLLISTAQGALFGLGLDALHSEREVLYRRAPTSLVPASIVRPSLSFRVRF